MIGSPASIEEQKAQLMSDPYRAYLYSYPHKMSYRELQPAVSLPEIWAQEAAETFFLYMHIPFCAARCGFCNLFTLPGNSSDIHGEYVAALRRQARELSQWLPKRPFARFALGGGTPTLLRPELLGQLFDIAQDDLGVDMNQVSISVETSPDTADRERMRLLSERGVDRVSMGIQSFIETEASAIYRPQKPAIVERALEVIGECDFPIVNLDLIYGLPGQSVSSWLYSLERALAYQPAEIFLYPLYTRDHTIVKPERIADSGPDLRMEMYIQGRALLKSHGYVQSSMRRFAKAQTSSRKSLLPFSCQEEGMLGLGSGARSYTRTVHYATQYAVSTKATRSIIADYVAQERFDQATYGYVLNDDEQRRRFVLKAVLHQEGLAYADYTARFGTLPVDDHALLGMLLDSGLAVEQDQRIRLTEEGLGYSDAIGAELISPQVRSLMEGFVVR